MDLFIDMFYNIRYITIPRVRCPDARVLIYFKKMDLNRLGRLYHIVILGLYVSTITYNVLMVPMTKIEMSYGGRLKFLTFIDLVSTHVLKHC